MHERDRERGERLEREIERLEGLRQRAKTAMNVGRAGSRTETYRRIVRLATAKLERLRRRRSRALASV